MGIMLAHISEPVPELPAEHAKYQPILNRLMAKPREDRYPDIAEFLSDLSAVAPKDSPANQTSYQLGTNQRSKSLLHTVMIAGVGVVITAIVFIGWQSFSETEEEPLPVAVPTAGLTEEMNDKVQRLLDSAQMHEIVGRFVAPPGSNALDAYKLVVEIDTTNEFALEKIKRLEAEHN